MKLVEFKENITLRGEMMKMYSIFKLVCILVCSVALFASCAGGSSASNGGSSAGDSTGGGSGEEPNDDGIIKNYDPYISPKERHIIAKEYLRCGERFIITESGEVYAIDGYGRQAERVDFYDKSHYKVTDDVKIVSGECIAGSREAILKSNEGKYYITNGAMKFSNELTFLKDKTTPYADGDEINFGNVEYTKESDNDYYYVAFKDGVIHFWSSGSYTSPIKVSGSNSFTQIYATGNALFAITSDGSLYKLNTDTMQMEEFKEIYKNNRNDYYVDEKNVLTSVIGDVKFKAIYSNGTFLSNDNHLYQYKDKNGVIYRLSAKKNDGTYIDDFIIDKMYEEGKLYYKYNGYVNREIVVNNDLVLSAKGRDGLFYNLDNSYFNSYISQFSSSYFDFFEPTNEIYNYYILYSNWQVFYKTLEGLDVIGLSSYGELGIGRDDKGDIITNTNGERMKVKFPESEGNINVERVLHVNNFNIFAFTDKGIYTWGKKSTGSDNLAVPEKVKAFKITEYPAEMGSVSGTYNCDSTLTYFEVTNIKVKDVRDRLFITEDGRVFLLYRGDFKFKKPKWGDGMIYKCSSDNVISNSFVQLDLGEGVNAKGFLDSERVLTNIGILDIWSPYYFQWEEIVGTIKD